MKALLLLYVCVSLYCRCSAGMEDGFHGMCVQMSGVDETLVIKLVSREFTECPKLKMYMKCIYEHSGFLNHDDTINVDELLEAMPDESRAMFEPVARACAAQGGSDVYEAVFNFAKCYSSAVFDKAAK